MAFLIRIAPKDSPGSRGGCCRAKMRIEPKFLSVGLAQRRRVLIQALIQTLIQALIQILIQTLTQALTQILTQGLIQDSFFVFLSGVFCPSILGSVCTRS